LNIEEYCSGYAVRSNAGVDKVVQVSRSVDGAAEVLAAKLERGEDMEAVEVGHDTFGHNLFEELAGTLQEANGSVRFRGGVVWLIGLRDDDNPGTSPRVYTKRETGGKERSKTGR
jgi:hypothetical protein